MATKIEWTHLPGFKGETWNPVTGCIKVSPGCANCYAETVAKRFWGKRKFEDVQNHTDRLAVPLRWRKPRAVFVNSMSDLFQKDVPFLFVAAVFGVMAACPDHVFQVLTKRPARMLEFFDWAREADSIGSGVNAAITEMFGHEGPNAYLLKGAPEHDDDDPEHISYRLIADPPDWPLPNVWLGVSVENQKTADERIPLLLKVPAAVRFVSYEPALAAVDFAPMRGPSAVSGLRWYRNWLTGKGDNEGGGCPITAPTSVDWVIVGGESGAGARPCNVAWVRSAIKQCRGAMVPCFVKQLGRNPEEFDRVGNWGLDLKDSKGGDPDEWPEDLRVREFPQLRGAKHGDHLP